MLKKLIKPLSIILVLGLLLRLLGFTHGFPFIFHPDEPAIIRTALGIRFDKNPGHFDWPHLYVYLNYFLYMGFAKVRDLLAASGLKMYVSSVLPLIWNDTLIFYALTRLFSGILGAFTVVPVYLAGDNLFGRRVAIIGAFVFAILPFHVWHSHYALSDVPMLFLMTWGLFFSSKILKSKELRNYILAGVFFGLAASMKYNGGLAVLLIPLAHFFRLLKNREETLFDFDAVMNLVFSGICSVVGFVVGTPYSVLDYKTFVRTDSPNGALWQFENVGTTVLADRPAKFFADMAYKVADDLGYVVLATFFILFLLLLVRLILRKNSSNDLKLWFLVLPAITFLVYISGFATSRSHYFMITYPFFAITHAYVVNKLFERLKNEFVSFLIVAALIFPLFFLSVRNTYIYTREDTRNILYSWASLELPQGVPVIYSDDDIGLVLNEVTINTINGYEKFYEQPTGSSGYIVVSYDSESPEDVFERFTYLHRTELVASIDNTLSKGPKLSIYKYIR